MPWGMAFDEATQTLLVCDYENWCIRRVSLTGTF
jgi:hypothetical protein